MKRREFITLLGVAAAWPHIVRAQQKSMPVIGYLNVGFPQLQHPFVIAFHEGLKDIGFIAGENLHAEPSFEGAHHHGGEPLSLRQSLIRQ